MRDPLVRLRRCEMLLAPHMKPLTEYAGKLRKLENCEVPNFDPFDGGTKALALFLFEKPGPMTADSNSGSGFISRNNDDPTAEATFNFMQTAGIPRELTVIWNVIPWWNGTRKVTSAELHAGVQCLEQLIGLLPKLHVVVFVGLNAAKARPVLGTTGRETETKAGPSSQLTSRPSSASNSVVAQPPLNSVTVSVPATLSLLITDTHRHANKRWRILRRNGWASRI